MQNLTKQDFKILRLLQNNSDRSSNEIANELHISQSPCWRKINQLEQNGIIKKKVALLDREALGIDLVAFTTINLTSSGRKNMEELEQQLIALDEVVECYTMTGAWDYMLKIITRDIRHFEKFIRETLLELPVIGELHSHLAVTEIKNTTELPLSTQL